VFGATLKPTVPLPVPAAPPVIVIHGELLTAVHTHPTAALTVVLPVPPDDAIDWLEGEMVGAHGAINEKLFERALAELPPGPTADTTASYTTVGVSGVARSATKSRRIIPSESGAGFPRLTVCSAAVPPAAKIASE
jgi:hypothetical protein